MLKSVIIFLLIVLIVVFQVSFIPEVFFFGIVPSLVLIVSIYWAMREDFSKALPKIVLIGLIYDLLSFYPIGTNIISLSVIAFATNSFTKRFVSQGNWKVGAMIFLAFFATILSHLILYFISGSLRYIGKDYFYVMESIFDLKIIFESFLNAIIFLIAYPIVIKIEKIIELYTGKRVSIKRS